MNGAVDNYQFSVHPSIIYSLITAQATGVEKALLELVMNSVDAHATRIDVKVDRFGFEVADNGRGFKDFEAIEQCFGILGLPHAEGDAYYGRFRLGRMQSFGYAKTKWHTKNFVIDVDLNLSPDTTSYGYHITEINDFYDGCKIEGWFYKERAECESFACIEDYPNVSPSQIEDAVLALAVSVRYLPVDVYINGVRANLREGDRFPFYADQTASYILTEADGIGDSLRNINVYNKGVFAYNLESTLLQGDIVSLGAIDLNMSRNSPKYTCKVAKAIRGRLTLLSEEVRLSRNKQTLEANYSNFIAAFWSKLLGVGGHSFEDAQDFYQMLRKQFFSLPNNTTLSYKRLVESYLMSGLYGDSYMGKRVISRPMRLYNAESCRAISFLESQFDYMGPDNGFWPIDMFPPSDFIESLKGDFKFNLNNLGGVQWGDFDSPVMSLSGDETIEKKICALGLYLIKIIAGFLCNQSRLDFNAGDNPSTQFEFGVRLRPSTQELREFRVMGLTQDQSVNSYYVDLYNSALKKYEDMPCLAGAVLMEEECIRLIEDCERRQSSVALNQIETRVFSILEDILRGLNRDIMEDNMKLLSSLGVVDDSFFIDRRLYVVEMDEDNVLAKTNGLDFILINEKYFRKCIRDNRLDHLLYLVMHELSHVNHKLSRSHGEVFYQLFYGQFTKIGRIYDWFMYSFSEYVFDNKHYRSKEAFESSGISLDLLESIIKRDLGNIEFVELKASKI